MPTDWKKLAEEAAVATDEQFKEKVAGLTTLTDKAVVNLIMETGISKKDLVLVLKEIKDSTKSNEEIAKSIRNIHKGLDVVVAIVKKLV